VRTCLDRLEADGVIPACDPDIIAARIKRADRRPQGWDLNLGMVRPDLSEADIVVLGAPVPRPCRQPRGRVTAKHWSQPSTDSGTDGVQLPHPAPGTGGPVDNAPGEVQQVHLAPGTGCNRRADGVQRRSYGVQRLHPNRPGNHPGKPPAASAHARQAPATATMTGGRQQAGEFFAVLGDGWRLTAAQRARLAPAVQAALEAGWSPQALAAFTGGNIVGVRNPYAVLAARLSPAGLPPPQRERPARPPWCGQCDEVTRMLGFDGDAPRPCPRCKPRVAARCAASAESLHTGIP